MSSFTKSDDLETTSKHSTGPQNSDEPGQADGPVRGGIGPGRRSFERRAYDTYIMLADSPCPARGIVLL